MNSFGLVPDDKPASDEAPSVYKIQFGGKERVLRYDFTAFCAMQDKFNVNVFDPSCFIPSPKVIAVLVWGGLILESPNLTIQKVVKSLAIEDIKAINRTCTQAILACLPKTDPDKKAEDVESS